LSFTGLPDSNLDEFAGNIGIHKLKALFARNLPAIEPALKKHSLVELDCSEVRVVV
jgi:predicted nuclease of predicted toxin-antitoxin system